MDSGNLPLVSICSITYNQENYITSTIEGFLLQKTSFPIEIIIHDDASTDKTAEIIRDYARKHQSVIFPIFQTENQYSKGVRGITLQFAFPRARGKYIAFCEGDDYWTDPLKLQKQFDFLEKNHEYGLVYTNFQKYYQASGRMVNRDCDLKISNGEIYYKYLNLNFIGTLTVLARSDLIKEYLIKFQETLKTWAMGDRPLWLYISSKSKCGFLEDYTAVYRRNANSISSFQDIYKEIEFLKSSYNIRYYFIENVRGVPEDIKVKVDDSYNRDLLNLYFRAKDKSNGKLVFSKIRNPRVKDYMRLLGIKNIFFRFLVNSLFRVLNLFDKNYG
jgi:glycosyltransferase involved in cell wall biosynthesis